MQFGGSGLILLDLHEYPMSGDESAGILPDDHNRKLEA